MFSGEIFVGKWIKKKSQRLTNQLFAVSEYAYVIYI